MRRVPAIVNAVLTLPVTLLLCCGGMSGVSDTEMDRAGQTTGSKTDDKQASGKASDFDDQDARGTDVEADPNDDGIDEPNVDRQVTDETTKLAGPEPELDDDNGAAPTEDEEPPTAAQTPEADRLIIDSNVDPDAADEGAEDETETSDGVETSNGIVPLEFVDDLSILVIFDNSGSMDTYWGNGSRWDIANQALYDALAPVATSLKVASIRFPLGAEDCSVPEFADDRQFGWQLAGEFLDAWEAGKIFPNGGTPMGQAFLAADAAIADARERGLLEDRFNVIVLTDGEPNCETDTTLLTELPAQWHERGVKTHVLGLPGSDAAAQLLDDIAAAGGTDEFVHLGSAEQLGDEVLVRAR